MKLTTRARYGTRALLDIALHPGRPVQLKHVASRQGISKKYLEQLLAPLKQAGIVNTQRGPAGGYQLARDPTQLGLGEILRVLEGPLELVDCVRDEGSQCARAEACAARTLWARIAGAIERSLDEVTLADMMATHHELASNAAGPPGCEP